MENLRIVCMCVFLRHLDLYQHKVLGSMNQDYDPHSEQADININLGEPAESFA